MKIDHVDLGLKLARSRAKLVKLVATASTAHPQNGRFMNDLQVSLGALDRFKAELDGVYHSEVTDAEFEELGHPYYPANPPKGDEIEIGIAKFRPRKEGRKPKFNSMELKAVSRCLSEVSESLEYARGMLAVYGSRNRFNSALKLATARCLAAKSHAGL